LSNTQSWVGFLSQLHRLSLALALVFLPATAHAQLEMQAYLGSSLSAPSPVRISQAGQPDLRFTGHWATRPFLDTWYYAGRLALWRGNRGWLLDFTHHKIYLTNPPPEVQRFQITNGMNMFTLSRGYRRGKLTYAVGAGPVVAAPITRIRGQSLPSDRGFFGRYFLAGGNLMTSITRRFPLGLGFGLLLDGRASTSYVRVPVAGGHTSVLNLAAHVHVGIGWEASH
jgi:hypothetical protein